MRVYVKMTCTNKDCLFTKESTVEAPPDFTFPGDEDKKEIPGEKIKIIHQIFELEKCHLCHNKLKIDEVREVDF